LTTTTFLALEFSTPLASVAVCHQNHVLASLEDSQPSPSERLWQQLHEVLHHSGKSLANLDAIDFGAGPGGFTGVRLACGIAQGLALSLKIPLFPVSTLECLTLTVPPSRVVTLLDARMNQVYLAAYDTTADGWSCVLEPRLCGPHDLPDLPSGDWIGVGSGAELWHELLRQRWPHQWQGVIPGQVPHATQIAQLARLRLENGSDQGVEARQAQPLYLRQRVALTRAERGK
jgi:tRNA threonylcarbamoyladenosine biosynthesis protein TsaB